MLIYFFKQLNVQNVLSNFLNKSGSSSSFSIPHCSHFIINFFQNFKISDPTLWKSLPRTRHVLWKSLWKLLKIMCFSVLVFHIFHRLFNKRLTMFQLHFPQFVESFSTQFHRNTMDCCFIIYNRYKTNLRQYRIKIMRQKRRYFLSDYIELLKSYCRMVRKLGVI